MKHLILISRRKNKKMSRAALAATLGVSESTIEKVEHGIRKASSGLAEEWAKILEIQVHEIWPVFFGREQDNMSCLSENHRRTDPDPAA